MQSSRKRKNSTSAPRSTHSTACENPHKIVCMDYELDDANVNSLEKFTNFNFAQAVVKILDNMGFSSATADSLELLTSMMRRYFDDVCQRIAANKELGNRQMPTLGDINMAFKAQNVSLIELNDYMRQVQYLPTPSPMPEYPVRKFSDSAPFESRIFLADPWADELPTVEELEEKYGKKKAEEPIEEQIEVNAQDESNVKKMDTSATTSIERVFDERPVEFFNSWGSTKNVDFPSFTGLSATSLGFDMDLYKRKFLEVDQKKKSKLQLKPVNMGSNPQSLFGNIPLHTIGSMPSAAKMDGLNSLVEKIKKHKNKERKKDKEHKKEKDREKRRHKEKKHRNTLFLDAPTLTPAVSLPTLEPISQLSDILKPVLPPPIITPSIPTISKPLEPVKTTNGALNKPVETLKPVEPIKIAELPKSETPAITPPPALEQITPITIPIQPQISKDVPPITQPIIQPVVVKETNEIKKEKRHKKDKKKEKKKKRDKDENRKRKHDKISTALPPVLEPLVQQQESLPTTAIVSTELELEATSIASQSNVIPPTEDKPPTSTSAPAVRLKIRIGSTLSSDSMKSSPVEAVTSKPHSASITPPILTKEEIVPKTEDAPKPLVSIIEEPTVSANPQAKTDEPPRKKHKASKKEKHDKNRESHGEQKSEQEKHKKRSKEHKEKKKHREKHSNGDSAIRIDAAKTDQALPSLPVENKESTVFIANEQVQAPKEPSLKIKFNKPNIESKAKETNQQVKDILAVIKESQGKKERVDKPESAEKSHKHKKHKKEKKHKKDRENQTQPLPSMSLPKPSDRPSSSASTGKLASKLAKPTDPKIRPASQNSSTLKLFEVPDVKPESEKKPELTVKKEKPGKPTFSTLENLKLQSIDSSSKSSTSSKSSNKSEDPKRTLNEKPSRSGKNPDEDVWVCPKCSIAYVDGAVDMIGCDGGCDQWYHFHCVGMLRPPPKNEKWFCLPCVTKRKKAKNRKK